MYNTKSTGANASRCAIVGGANVKRGGREWELI